MEAMIDESGILFIKRLKKYKQQYCPKTSVKGPTENWIECGDWCPLFGEPQFKEIEETFTLELCDHSIMIKGETFIDKRLSLP